jgi:hypothetical protein
MAAVMKPCCHNDYSYIYHNYWEDAHQLLLFEIIMLIDAFWIVRVAPISLKTFLWVKFAVYALPPFIP